MAPRASDHPIPIGFGIALDDSVRQLGSGVWFGGSPARVMRLTASGRTAWHELDGGEVSTRSAGHLARRLTDAGLAHPRPPVAARAEVTVLVPTLDRPDSLARCLAALGQEYPVVVVDDGSADPAAIAAVAREHGARLVRREVNGGPAAARNTGLAAIATEFVAFVDSDCIPSPNWVAPLIAHLADPLLAAVAPRITASAPQSWAGRYTAARGSLDLGAHPGRVAPTARVSYVPTAALVTRRSALVAIARSGYVFDPALRFGEDVDLVWRLDAAGWRVRYDPSVQVEHHEPTRWTELWRRRFRYGTSAAPLARAHPRSAAPLVVHAWPTLTVVALLARRPVPAAAAFAMTVISTVRALRRADVPTDGTVRTMAGAVHQTWLGLGRYGTQFASPALLAAAVAPGRRGRRLAAASLLLGPPLAAWFERRPDLDPPRFVAAHLADEIAYGTGVWAGCISGRTTAPLRPLVNRSRRRRKPDQGETA
jgi:mycofactocin system glycosyltransferase